MSKQPENQVLSGCIVRAAIQREQVTQLCEHYACRCARAEELSQMADRIENTIGVTAYSHRLRLDAVNVHEQLVRCRMTG